MGLRNNPNPLNISASGGAIDKVNWVANWGGAVHW